MFALLNKTMILIFENTNIIVSLFSFKNVTDNVNYYFFININIKYLLIL